MGKDKDKDEEDEEDEEDEDEDDEDEGEGEAPGAKPAAGGGDGVAELSVGERLGRLRARRDTLEEQKVSLLAAAERAAQEARRGVGDRSAVFLSAVAQREATLRKALDETQSHADRVSEAEPEAQGEPLLATQSSARDAALALAWLALARRGELQVEPQGERAQQGEEATQAASAAQGDDVLRLGYAQARAWLAAELRSLKQMSLAAKVTASVSAGMQRLLNFGHDWLTSLLPHCLAKVNRVTFGLLTPVENWIRFNTTGGIGVFKL